MSFLARTLSSAEAARSSSVAAVAARRPRAAGAATPLSERCPELVAAMTRYVYGHSSFKSSAALADVEGAMTKAADLRAAVVAPISYRIFPYEAAIQWGLAVKIFVDHFAAEELAAAEGGEGPAGFCVDMANAEVAAAIRTFALESYYTDIIKIYDIARDDVLAYCAEDEDDEDDEDAEDEEGEDADAGEDDQ